MPKEPKAIKHKGPPLSRDGVIELGEVQIKFTTSRTQTQHSYGMMSIARKHIQAMKAEIVMLRGVHSVSGAKPKFDIYL